MSENSSTSRTYPPYIEEYDGNHRAWNYSVDLHRALDMLNDDRSFETHGKDWHSMSFEEKLEIFRKWGNL